MHWSLLQPKLTIANRGYIVLIIYLLIKRLLNHRYILRLALRSQGSCKSYPFHCGRIALTIWQLDFIVVNVWSVTSDFLLVISPKLISRCLLIVEVSIDIQLKLTILMRWTISINLYSIYLLYFGRVILKLVKKIKVQVTISWRFK